MPTIYTLESTTHFDHAFKKLTKHNKNLELKILDAIEQIGNEPFAQSLRTHKVDSTLFGYAYSSRVTGDIRIYLEF